MFQNREEAGQLLSDKLLKHKDNKNTIVLAIPRGGMVVGKQISDRLKIPLSAIIVKKLGAPHNPELAIGALAPEGVKYIDWELVLRSGVEQSYLDREIREKSKEIGEREKKLRTKNLELRTKNYNIFILVDDGIATGATVLAAIKYLKEKLRTQNLRPRTIMAVPVIASDTYEKLKNEVDEIIALEITDNFGAVGQFYREFPQVTDEEVIKHLK